MTLDAKAARIRLVIFDVDGVLTDGRVLMHADGTESKEFHIRDGAAIVWAQRAGLPVALLSARSSAATTQRAAQLSVRIVAQGVADKLTAYTEILGQTGLDDEAVAYMGDDLLDLPVLRRVGLSSAPSDAAGEVRAAVDWTASQPGGRGAARELIELVLRAQKRWDEVVRLYAS
jgi:3-deoxy-D-manno-octulosonate 8-phosphate phosphatase (KDO 8-P phosphatase)